MNSSASKTIIWTIENFRVCTEKNGMCIESPTFTAEHLDESTWCILLYPNGRKEIKKDFICCCLKRLDDSRGPDEVECDWTVEAIDGKNISLKIPQCVSKFKKGVNLGYDEFLKRELIFNSTPLSSRDILTIQVTLKNNTSNIVIQENYWTKIEADYFSFKWIVKNSLSSKPNTKLVSFSKNLQFEAILGVPKDDVEISIRSLKRLSRSQKLICRVTLVDLKGEEADSKEAILESDDADVNNSWKFPIFLKTSKITTEKHKYLQENNFTLKFDLAFSSGERKDIVCKSLDLHSSQACKPIKTDLYLSLKSDLKYVFDNPIHTDAELHVGKKVFRVHKIILCARSPVFLAMFNQDMVEKQTGVIHISDVGDETLNSLLEFMYTGDTDILDYESALKLLLVADKYQVLSLKEKGSSSLESFLSDENVCDILLTADLVQQESLKESAVDYIKEHSKKVFKSDEWKQLAEKNLKLATETFCEVSKDS